MIATSATWKKWNYFLDNSKEMFFFFFSFCSYHEMLTRGTLAIANTDKKVMPFYNSQFDFCWVKTHASEALKEGAKMKGQNGDCPPTAYIV
jgi:hypothetical protein